MFNKCPIKFEDIPTLSTIRTGIDIEFCENLQIGGGLTNVLGANDVLLTQMRRHSLLLHTFLMSLA